MLPCCLSTAPQHAALLCTQQCSTLQSRARTAQRCHVVVLQPELCVVTANEVRSIKAIKSHLLGFLGGGSSQISYTKRFPSQLSAGGCAPHVALGWTAGDAVLGVSDHARTAASKRHFAKRSFEAPLQNQAQLKPQYFLVQCSVNPNGSSCHAGGKVSAALPPPSHLHCRALEPSLTPHQLLSPSWVWTPQHKGAHPV